MRAFFLSILFLMNSVNGWSQAADAIKDLKEYWIVINEDQQEEYRGQSVHAVHLPVIDQFRGGVISIEAPGEFSLFINGQLQTRVKSKLNLNVDSLLAARNGILLLSIFQKDDVKTIQTSLTIKAHLEGESFGRSSNHFNDFVILSTLVLFGFFVILFRSNTRLTIDYLNLAKVFSFQEREEAIVTGRIGSSVNILFFAFISLLFGLLLIVIFNEGPPVLHFSIQNSITSTATGFSWWLLVSFIILTFLFTKLTLIWGFSALFGFKGVVRFHFFNFIRSLYVASALTGVALSVYFILELRNPDFFYFVLVSASGFMVLGVFFLYFKLMGRTSSSVFHLFSYLCGSEIIPLMILIKVLLN